MRKLVRDNEHDRHKFAWEPAWKNIQKNINKTVALKSIRRYLSDGFLKANRRLYPKDLK
jgi:hypothetical protein